MKALLSLSIFMPLQYLGLSYGWYIPNVTFALSSQITYVSQKINPNLDWKIESTFLHFFRNSSVLAIEINSNKDSNSIKSPFTSESCQPSSSPSPSDCPWRSDAISGSIADDSWTGSSHPSMKNVGITKVRLSFIARRIDSRRPRTWPWGPLFRFSCWGWQSNVD